MYKKIVIIYIIIERILCRQILEHILYYIMNRYYMKIYTYRVSRLCESHLACEVDMSLTIATSFYTVSVCRKNLGIIVIERRPGE